MNQDNVPHENVAQAQLGQNQESQSQATDRVNADHGAGSSPVDGAMTADQYAKYGNQCSQTFETRTVKKIKGGPRLDKQDIKSSLTKRIKSIIYGVYAKDDKNALTKEIWTAVSAAIMEYLGQGWEASRDLYSQQRQAHYFSAEFLVGRSLLNSLINLDIDDILSETLAEMGHDLHTILDEETDPGLGNGGLGRLAACFMDSCASQELPVTGYGILYRYGLFKQAIEEGFQKEYPDPWMELPYPLIIRCATDTQIVHYQDFDVQAVPYDLPVPGYATDNVNTIRLWKPEPNTDFDFNLFNSQRFDEAVILRNRVQDINRVLYPNDTSYDGKVLRVRQQYFFVSASLQFMLKNYIKYFGEDLSGFAELNKVQLNDTHPALAIPELMRLLMDDYHMPWDKAWSITTETFAYTNHTTLAEALEKWDLNIFQFLFPRILEIIREIDRRFREELQAKGLTFMEIDALAPLHGNQVHMAWLSCYGSSSINGVAQIHTDILKQDTLRGFYELWPDKFSNKTNGVTPRRWLRLANPELSNLLTELSGNDNWVKNLNLLKDLEVHKDDLLVLERFDAIKKTRKEKLAAFVKKSCGQTLDTNMIFDVQVKRIHEYKRQLMNAFAILHEYYAIKDNPNLEVVPTCYIIAGKAAPGYFNAKAIIKFINEVANLVNNDPACKGKMEVHFLPNYNVTMGEQIFPAADISEQISTVGKEASGTSNMKFMMNGAITLGTLDGANLEICATVGEDNCFIFGPHAEDFPATIDYYNSHWQYEHIPGLKRVVDALVDGTLPDQGSGMFQALYQSLITGTNWAKGDPYYVLGDFEAFLNRRQDIQKAYLDRTAWNKMCWINICRSATFSSDRTIYQYATDIWKVKPVSVIDDFDFLI